MIKPGSVVDNPIFELSEYGHGTWMADDLLKVAPDVKIMPIRFVPTDRSPDYVKKEYPQNLRKGIEYAVKNGADIITISHQPIPKEWQDRLDKAIQKASQANVTIVYIHYYGRRKDIIVSRPIEFSEKDSEYVYVIGTGFINEYSFPFTWGFSQTAPVVGGVISMMKELKPELRPAEIREILLQASRPIERGYKLLDAYKALDIVQSKK